MTKGITIEQLRKAIKKLPSDESKVQPGIWYKTQKEHWLGWLKDYRGSGAYGRKGGKKREAEFVYNHVVNYGMLIWIMEAAGVDPKLIKKSKLIVDGSKSMQANAGAVRKIVPWEILANALWENGQ